MFNKGMSRLFPVVLALVVLSACGLSDDREAGPARTRTVTDALGEQTIPADPQRILALDEHSAMAMMVVGVKPQLVYATVSSQTSAAILREAGVEIVDEPEFLSAPDLEQVVADKPDLIVMSEAGPLPQSIDAFRKIAPAVVLSYGKGWQAALEESAEVFDAQAAGKRVKAVMDRRIGQLNQALPDDGSLSITFGYQDTLDFPSPSAPMSLLIEELGLTRPEAEQTSTGEKTGEFIVPFSAERLDDHDATRMAILSGTYYDSALVRDQPVFATMDVAADKRAADVDGETWWGNSVFTSWWILDDVEAMFLGKSKVGAVDDAVTRWNGLQDALS